MRHTVTDIKIEKIENDPKGLLGFCSFTVDGAFRFDGVAIFSRMDGGLRLSWPEKQRGLKKIKTAMPIHPASFIEIESQIAEAMK